MQEKQTAHHLDTKCKIQKEGSACCRKRGSDCPATALLPLSSKLKSRLVVIRPQIPQGRPVVHVGTGL